MSTSSTFRRCFTRGYLAGLPFVIVVAPFGLLFGMIAGKAGFDLVQTFAMTTLVLAGASQFTAVALMQEQAPTLIVVLTALAVNLRLALYSVSLAPHLGPAPLRTRALAAFLLVDQSFALAMGEYAKREMGIAEKSAYFLGASLAITPFWVAGTMVGAVAGQAIPPDYALDFAVPLSFIALFAPALRDLPSLAAAMTSVVATLALMWVPWSMGLMIAAVLAMIVGAQTELWLRRRQAREARP